MESTPPSDTLILVKLRLPGSGVESMVSTDSFTKGLLVERVREVDDAFSLPTLEAFDELRRPLGGTLFDLSFNTGIGR